jgi:hypothetical protein
VQIFAAIAVHNPRQGGRRPEQRQQTVAECAVELRGVCAAEEMAKATVTCVRHAADVWLSDAVDPPSEHQDPRSPSRVTGHRLAPMSQPSAGLGQPSSCVFV